MRQPVRWTSLPAGAALLLALTTPLPSPQAAGTTSVSTPTGEIREIRGPLPPTRLFPWLIPVGSAVILAGAGALLILRGSRQRAPRPEPPPPSPGEALDLLERRFAHGEEVGLLYRELSALVRLSLEERTGLPALRMTSEELLEGIAAQEGSRPEEAGRLRSFLLRCDLVKFAGVKPTVAEIGADLVAARSICFSGRATSHEP